MKNWFLMASPKVKNDFIIINHLPTHNFLSVNLKRLISKWLINSCAEITIHREFWFQNVSEDVYLRKKCPYSELFWSAFSRIRTGYEEIRSISPYSIQMRENADQNNSEYQHFLLNVWCSNTKIHQSLTNDLELENKLSGE